MAKFTVTLMFLVLFIAAMVSASGYRFEGFSKKPEQVVLTRCVPRIIYDGDTFGCDFDGDGLIRGQKEHVRMLGIDASEMHYSRKNRSGRNQPCAVSATRFLEAKILRQPVFLEYDRQHLDKYDRTLAYVYRDPQRKQMLNTDLLSKGLAKVLFIGVNRKYEGRFHQAAREARQHKLGLWSKSPASSCSTAVDPL